MSTDEADLSVHTQPVSLELRFYSSQGRWSIAASTNHSSRLLEDAEALGSGFSEFRRAFRWISFALRGVRACFPAAAAVWVRTAMGHDAAAAQAVAGPREVDLRRDGRRLREDGHAGPSNTEIRVRVPRRTTLILSP